MGYDRVGKYDIQEVLSLVPSKFKKGRIMTKYENYLVNINSERYHTFKNSGTNCVKCGLPAAYFALEQSKGQKGVKSFHFNLYGIDAGGKEVMFTKDHIVARSIGGEDHPNNYQTMCLTCNGKKTNLKNVSIKVESVGDETYTIFYANKQKVHQVKGLIFTIKDVKEILEHIGAWVDLDDKLINRG